MLNYCWHLSYFIFCIMTLVQKRRRQLQAQTVAIAKKRQQRLRQQQHNRY